MSKYIAVTGGIGSGKSAVLHILKEEGYPTFSCDEIYKEIARTPEYIAKIQEAFPSCVKNGEIDKKALATLVFQDKACRAQLNAIAHPLIMQRLHIEMRAVDAPLVFAEVPLLFECGFQSQFDGVWYVYRKKTDRIAAVTTRDGIDRKQVLRRIKSQFNPDCLCGKRRLKKCGTILIENDKSIEELKSQVGSLLKALQ